MCSPASGRRSRVRRARLHRKACRLYLRDRVYAVAVLNLHFSSAPSQFPSGAGEKRLVTTGTWRQAAPQPPSRPTVALRPPRRREAARPAPQHPGKRPGRDPRLSVGPAPVSLSETGMQRDCRAAPKNKALPSLLLFIFCCQNTTLSIFPFISPHSLGSSRALRARLHTLKSTRPPQ